MQAQKPSFFLKLVFVGLIFFIVLHFSFSAIYQTQGKYTPIWVNSLVGTYMRTFFHQDWRLFAPDPPLCHVRLQYKYLRVEGEESDWVNLSKEILETHQKHLVSSASIKYRMHQELARTLHQDYQRCKSASTDSLEQNQCFLTQKSTTIAKELVLKHLNQPQKRGAIQLKYECVRYRVGARSFEEDSICDMLVFPLIPSHD